jgi:hypothetical protein
MMALSTGDAATRSKNEESLSMEMLAVRGRAHENDDETRRCLGQ